MITYMQKTQTKSCLVVTYGPVPTSQYQTVEGGGMRAWGLAKGLQRNGIDVTVAVNNSFKQDLEEFEDIKLINWGLDDTFADVINSFDAVVISYCMGDASVFVADRINDDVQLILDAYVPIYIEVSARESKDILTEYKNYAADIVRFNHVLKRGDYFLCASESQKTFYTGVLSSLGIINPRSYREDRILIVPFGIHDDPIDTKENPYEKFGIKKSDFVVLYFGGLYPWFRVEELLDAMKNMSSHKDIKFVFVGGKNPFNPNPDFFRQYEKTVKFAKDEGLEGKTIFFEDWVDFNDRVNWYVHADMVISLNQPGEENGFSWRTRVMDYVWGELAILTNGGDPLSEILLKNDAALRLKHLSSEAIDEALLELYENRTELQNIKQNVKNIKPEFYWHTIVAPMVTHIQAHTTPWHEESTYVKKNDLQPANTFELSEPVNKSGKLSKAIRLVPRTISYARRKGLITSVKMSANMAKTQAKKRLRSSQDRQFVFIAHPMDNTGGPLVLMQIIEEFAKKYGGKRVRLIAPMVLPEHQEKLKKLGVKFEKAAHALSFRMIRLQLGLKKNDFVMMNTIAIYDNYREFILLWLKTGRLNHAYWFIHEDQAQIPATCPSFIEKVTVDKIHNMAKKKKLTLLTPSERTRQEYSKLLNVTNIKSVPLHVEVDKKYLGARPASDYKEINFLLSGTASDGRKGQLLALSAFYYFIANFQQKDPRNYRNFTLDLVAIKDDYISQQIKWIGDSLLGKHLKMHPQVSKQKAMEITSKCNAVICCSLNETFGLYVAEGMLMGHLVLRNDSAGMDEQLKDGVNGYYINHHDIKQFAGVIEKILNKKTSDEQLQKMGVNSQKIIQAYEKHSYIETIGS